MSIVREKISKLRQPAGGFDFVGSRLIRTSCQLNKSELLSVV